MASHGENKEFVDSILSSYPLDDAIEFIQKRLSIDEVFEQTDIDDFCETWARDNGYTKECE